MWLLRWAGPCFDSLGCRDVADGRVTTSSTAILSFAVVALIVADAVGAAAGLPASTRSTTNESVATGA